MRSGILVLLLVGLLPVASLGVVSYSCRDSQGELHFADSPANLPAECAGQAQKIETGKVDNLNIVPSAPAPSGSGAEFDDAVRAVERQQVQQQQQIEQLKQRAKQLADSYQEAVTAKRSALKRWSYSSREKIDQADQQIAQARDGKQQLLQELGSVRMPADVEQKIRQRLESIENQ